LTCIGSVWFCHAADQRFPTCFMLYAHTPSHTQLQQRLRQPGIACRLALDNACVKDCIQTHHPTSKKECHTWGCYLCYWRVTFMTGRWSAGSAVCAEQYMLHCSTGHAACTLHRLSPLLSIRCCVGFCRTSTSYHPRLKHLLRT
jgi:hypothetical protein